MLKCFFVFFNSVDLDSKFIVTVSYKDNEVMKTSRKANAFNSDRCYDKKTRSK